MLHYLKIFSWFLFTFAVVGGIALLAGMEPTMTTTRKGLGLMAMQAGISSLILIGFRLNNNKQLSAKRLLYGGWILLALLVVVGQVWLTGASNQSQLPLGNDADGRFGRALWGFHGFPLAAKASLDGQ